MGTISHNAIIVIGYEHKEVEAAPLSTKTSRTIGLSQTTSTVGRLLCCSPQCGSVGMACRSGKPRA